MPIQRSDPPTTKVVYISRSGEPLIRHTIHIADLGSEFDWWCSCRLINGSEKSSAQDAEHDAVQLHESQGEPITRPDAIEPEPEAPEFFGDLEPRRQAPGPALREIPPRPPSHHPDYIDWLAEYGDDDVQQNPGQIDLRHAPLIASPADESRGDNAPSLSSDRCRASTSGLCLNMTDGHQRCDQGECVVGPDPASTNTGS